MEFWGVEVKPGETLSVKPELFEMIHISQASLGEFKNVKGNTNVPVRLQIDGKKFVIGFLSTEDRPQMMVDLVFEKEFQLSHDFKNGSVYFIGYTADDGTAENSDDEDEDIPSDEDVVLPDDSPAKGVLYNREPQIKGGNSDSDESEDDDAAEESSDDLSDDDESEDEPEPPKKNQLMKKRAEPVALPPAKKPKLSAPQKTGGAKNGQAGKGPSPKNKGKNGKRFQKRA